MSSRAYLEADFAVNKKPWRDEFNHLMENSFDSDRGDLALSSRFRANLSLRQLISTFLESKNKSKVEIQEKLLQYTESLVNSLKELGPASSQVPERLQSILYLKYNVALALFINDCPNLVYKYLSKDSIIKKCENRHKQIRSEMAAIDSESSSKGRDLSYLNCYEFKVLLEKTKQLMCEALLEVDDLTTCKDIITSAMKEISESNGNTDNYLNWVSDTPDVDNNFVNNLLAGYHNISGQYLGNHLNNNNNNKKHGSEASFQISRGKNGEVKRIENYNSLIDLVKKRYWQLALKRIDVERAWRSLSMRLSIKEKNPYQVNAQIDNLRKIDDSKINFYERLVGQYIKDDNNNAAEGVVDRLKRDINYQNRKSEEEAYVIYRFYSAHADFINGYRQKSRAMIKNLNVNFDEDFQKLKELYDQSPVPSLKLELVRKLHLRSRQLNNLAVIELCEGNISRAQLSFSKAYQHLKFGKLDKTVPENLTEQPSDVIPVLKGQSKTGIAISYNFAISCLFNGNYDRAFKILTEKIVLQYPTSPRVWLRIAHCCISAHQEAVKNYCTFDKQQIYKMNNRSLFKLSNTDHSNVRAGNGEMSLEYAASAIRNCLRLLVRYEANISSKDSENIRMSCKPGNPLTNAGHSELKTHALLAGSYIQLQLENWLTAVEYAERIIEKEIDYCTDNYYLCWLCYTYQATAYMSSGNTKKGVQILYKAMSLVINKENFASWQAKLYDGTGISTTYGVGPEGGRLAMEAVKKYGLTAGPATIISDVNEWRLLNMTNLAAAYCLQGKTKQSVSILERAGEFLNRAHMGKQQQSGQRGPSVAKASCNSLGQQQFDSVRTYIAKTLDKDGG